METDRAASTKTTIKIHIEFNNVFMGIGCLKDTFSLKEDAKPYHIPLRCVAYTLQEVFKRVRKTP